MTLTIGMKACKDIRAVAAIAVKLAHSSIHCVEDLWASEKIKFDIFPEPRTMSQAVLKEIVMRSVEEYLKRPGHVLLPAGMIPDEEFEKERCNHLLRVQKFWAYWHGSKTLNYKRQRTVSTIQST